MTVDLVRREFPFHGVEEVDGARYYLIDGRRLMSVTTALGGIHKEGLVRAAASRVADAAYAELPAVVASSRKKPCGNPRKCKDHDWQQRCEQCPCGECKQCVRSRLAYEPQAHMSRRADEGQRVHDWAEHWVLSGGEHKPHDGDIAPYIKSFLAFVDTYQVRPEDYEAAEALVVNYDHDYAGQTDGLPRIHANRSPEAAKVVSRVLVHREVQRAQAASEKPNVRQFAPKKCADAGLSVLVIIDYKTRESSSGDIYPENALQLAGYRNAPILRIKETGEEFPMPAADAGAVIQLRPDGFTFRLVLCDRGVFERGFLPAMQMWRYLSVDGPASVSSHTFVLPDAVERRAREAANAAAVVGPVDNRPPARTTAGKAKNNAPQRSTTQRVLGTDPFALVPAPAGADLPF